MSRRNDVSPPPPFVVVLALLGIAFVVVPLAGLVARAPWSGVGSMWTPGARAALRTSVVVTAGAAALSLVVGVPVAIVLDRSRFRGAAFVRGIVLLPMVLPPVVGGVALLASLGRNHFLGKILAGIGIELPFTTGGAVVAAAFVSTPLLILAVEAGLRSMDPRLEEAASAMGASRWTILRRVTLPLIRPQIVAGVTLAAARSLGEFGATITFAGNISGRTQTLPLSVFETLQTDPGAAILQSLLLVAVSLTAIVALRGYLFQR